MKAGPTRGVMEPSRINENRGKDGRARMHAVNGYTFGGRYLRGLRDRVARGLGPARPVRADFPRYFRGCPWASKVPTIGTPMGPTGM